MKTGTCYAPARTEPYGIWEDSMPGFKAAAMAVAFLWISGAATCAEGIWVGQGPISCLIPVDSISRNECDESLVISGQSGQCKMSATKDGIDYTVNLRASRRRIPGLLLDPIEGSIPRFKGKVERCVISDSVSMAKCTTWGNDYHGGGSCTFCTSNGCYRGTAEITLTPNARIRRTER
jgi:hypothetical protein